MTTETEEALKQRYKELCRNLAPYLNSYDIYAFVTKAQKQNIWWLCHFKDRNRLKGKQEALYYQGKYYLAKNYTEGVFLIYNSGTRNVYTSTNSSGTILARRDFMNDQPLWSLNRELGQRYEDLFFALEDNDFCYMADEYRTNVVMLRHRIDKDILLLNDLGENVMKRK